MTDTAKVVGEILAGGHDGHTLEIVEAVQVRMATGFVQTRWILRHGDIEVTEETVTVGEIRTVEQYLSAARGGRVTWLQIDPRENAGDFMAVLAVLLQTRGGMSLPEAEKVVAGIAMGDIKEHIDQYELAPAPKD